MEHIQDEVRRKASADRVTFCIEGNIGAGKSTYLHMVQSGNDALALNEVVEVVPEPVELWQNVDNEGENLLQRFYEKPERYAFTFQQYVLVTRINKVRRPHTSWTDPGQSMPNDAHTLTLTTAISPGGRLYPVARALPCAGARDA